MIYSLIFIPKRNFIFNYILSSKYNINQLKIWDYLDYENEYYAIHLINILMFLFQFVSIRNYIKICFFDIIVVILKFSFNFI